MKRSSVLGGFHAMICSSILGISSPAAAKDLIEYFQPMPITSPLTRMTWGAPNVVPRDVKNGLEDTNNKFCYWDGKILRDKNTGKYHLFGSRWSESAGHGGWGNSVAIQGVSSTVDGPYVEQGLLWPTNQNGKGHNVTATELPDGRYAVVVSETRPGDIFTSSSLDGPWRYEGSMKFDTNGVTGVTQLPSNVSLIVRPDDGKFMAVSRHGFIMISDALLGPYVLQGPSVYPKISGLNNGNAEDPVLWYSGGMYHITVNWWDAKQAYHLASTDGVKNWKNMGLAYTPSRDYIKYTDGTSNRWTKIERPGVVIEDGHVTHFTFAVIDVEKALDLGNDNHGSKVIVVPFDGLQFDIDNGGCGADCSAPGRDAGASDAGRVGDSGRADGGATEASRSDDGSADSGATVSDGDVPAADDGAAGSGGEGKGGNGAGGAGTSAGASGESGASSAGASGGPGAGGASAGSAAGSRSTATAGSAAGSAPASDASGCACETSRRHHSSSTSALVAMAGVLGLVARRRRANRSHP